MAKLRVGIAGTGGIARSVHIPGLKKLSDRVEIVSAFDIAADRVKKTAQEFGIPHSFTDFDAMLSGPALDAVVICTPPSSHAPLAVKAFAHGLHVLCEKPVSVNATGALQIVEAAKRAKRVLMVGFQHRFSRPEKTLKRAIDDGALGEIYYARAQSLRRRGIPGWGVFGSKELSGGGPMMDIGVHVLDQTVYLLGNPTPVTVFGMTYQKIANRPGFNSFGPWDPTTFETEDFATAQVRFANGLTLLLEASWALNIGQSMHNVLLCGTRGGAELTPLKIYTEQHGMLFNMELPEGVFRGPDSSQDEKIAHFVDCIQHGTTPIVTPSEILNVALILDAVYESAQTGKSVDINIPQF
ncbi:MAG: Gfo/Idh/MocA family oxidoreductase [Chloroflexi bacterium]|nr:Gfo/Idh/MocA family oxidoreductase [Chloroflexota bacterium]